MRQTAETLKASLTPERYYAAHLAGSFGKQTGKGWHLWNGLCPFHADRRPGSFVVNKVSGAFRCFSCGTGGGDIIAFHMQRRGIGFIDALAELTGAANA
jgi:putative DNA primase/helicase